MKDAIESIGVPHVEVGMIMTGQVQKDFAYILLGKEDIHVYPYHYDFGQDPLQSISGNFPLAFILDGHLGKLARLLRMMGVDVYYEPHLDDHQIARISAKENRNVLTRDIGLLKHKIIRFGYWLRSQNPDEQVLEVIRHFSLVPHLHPFTRCIACNGPIKSVSKRDILSLIPSDTAFYFQDFFQCEICKRVYWKGSHYDHMVKTIGKIERVIVNGKI